MTDKTRGDGEITWAARRYVLVAEEKWDKTQGMDCGRSVYDNLCHQIRAHSKRIDELEKERDAASAKLQDAEVQVGRFLASNARLTSECDAARTNEATWKQQFELATKSATYWKKQVESGTAVDVEQEAKIYAVMDELSKANDKAAAWEKARDAERETVQRLQKDLRISESMNNDLRERGDWLEGKVYRLHKELKHLRKEADR